MEKFQIMTSFCRYEQQKKQSLRVRVLLKKHRVNFHKKNVLRSFIERLRLHLIENSDFSDDVKIAVGSSIQDWCDELARRYNLEWPDNIRPVSYTPSLTRSPNSTGGNSPALRHSDNKAEAAEAEAVAAEAPYEAPNVPDIGMEQNRTENVMADEGNVRNIRFIENVCTTLFFIYDLSDVLLGDPSFLWMRNHLLRETAVNFRIPPGTINTFYNV